MSQTLGILKGSGMLVGLRSRICTGRRSWPRLGDLGHSRTRVGSIRHARGPPSRPRFNLHAKVMLSYWRMVTDALDSSSTARVSGLRGRTALPNLVLTEKTLFHVVPGAQCVVERARVLFMETRHLGPGVEPLGCGVRLDVYDGPAAAVSYGVAVFAAPVRRIVRHVAGAFRHHLISGTVSCWPVRALPWRRIPCRGVCGMYLGKVVYAGLALACCHSTN